jgi:hypothetical protein
MIERDGGLVDDGDACFTGGGPQAYLRRVADAGVGGDLIWTHATASAAEANYAHWELVLAEAGRYRLEVSTPAAYARSKRARYLVKAGGAETEIRLDQTAADGWQLLGYFDFAAGGMQSVHLGDNTGEPSSDDVQVVFDAVRLTRVADDAVPEPGEEPGAVDDGGEDGDGGCSAGGGGGGLVALGLCGCFGLFGRLGRGRRRRRALR